MPHIITSKKKNVGHYLSCVLCLTGAWCFGSTNSCTWNEESQSVIYILLFFLDHQGGEKREGQVKDGQIQLQVSGQRSKSLHKN